MIGSLREGAPDEGGWRRVREHKVRYYSKYTQAPSVLPCLHSAIHLPLGGRLFLAELFTVIVHGGGSKPPPYDICAHRTSTVGAILKSPVCFAVTAFTPPSLFSQFFKSVNLRFLLFSFALRAFSRDKKINIYVKDREFIVEVIVEPEQIVENLFLPRKNTVF